MIDLPQVCFHSLCFLRELLALESAPLLEQFAPTSKFESTTLSHA
jgi:hypothetical protein